MKIYRLTLEEVHPDESRTAIDIMEMGREGLVLDNAKDFLAAVELSNREAEAEDAMQDLIEQGGASILKRVLYHLYASRFSTPTWNQGVLDALNAVEDLW